MRRRSNHMMAGMLFVCVCLVIGCVLYVAVRPTRDEPAVSNVALTPPAMDEEAVDADYTEEPVSPAAQVSDGQTEPRSSQQVAQSRSEAVTGPYGLTPQEESDMANDNYQ